MMRWDVINLLIQRYGFQSYLEIGSGDGLCFDQIQCPKKVGVDPNHKSTFRVTSNRFFHYAIWDRFDLVFIDGDHTSTQVQRDLMGALECLNLGGIVVVHDTLPTEEIHQVVPQAPGIIAWTGDAWRAVATMRMVLPTVQVVTIDTDWGITLIRKGKSPTIESRPCDWKAFQVHRNELLNVVSVEHWLATEGQS